MITSTDLSNKVALVTGGSNGIGASTVEMLAKAGAKVIVGFYSGEKRAIELINSLPKNDHQILKINLEDKKDTKRIFKFIESKYGKLDILINSAGFTKPIPHKDIEKLNCDLFDKILLANARGPYLIIRELIPLLQMSEEGSVVVNVSSISAFTGSGSNIAYCAAKAAVDTMTMSLARVFGPKIRFLCVSPAAVDTGFVEGRDRITLEKLALQTPLREVVEPKDVALSIMACITHLKTSTGTRVIIDGGKHL